MSLPTNFNPYAPIPNTPFYGVQEYFIQGFQGPLILGAGFSINFPSGTLNTSGGGGAGSVSQIIAGTAISVSPAGGTGNVVVTNTGVTQLIAGTGVAITGSSGVITVSAIGGAGTVTLINSGSGLTGGPISTSGTLALNYSCVVDPTDFNAKGDILAGTGVGAYSALGVGGNGTVLTACTGCSNGVFWGSSSAQDIPCAAITAKGTLITGTAASTPFSLGVGVDSYVLTACSTAGSGLCWAPAAGGAAAATPLNLGTVFGLTENTGSYNTALGSQALLVASGGAANVAIGAASGIAATTALGNTLVGGGSACCLIDGNFNVAAGYLALSAVNSGDGNVGVGNNAGGALTGEDYNVVIGGHPGIVAQCNNIILSDGQGVLRLTLNCCGALSPDGATFGTVGQVLCSNGPASQWTWTSAAGGSSNATPTVAGIALGCTTATQTAIGCNAMLSAIGYGNTAVGCAALGSVTTGINNSALGFSSLCSNTGDNNTAIGHCSGRTITSGIDNTAIGFASMARGGPLTGSNNTGVGVSALSCLTSGTGNTVVGWEPGCTLTTGGCNIAFGYRALGCGSAAVTGNTNIAIGTAALSAITSGASNIVIGGASHASISTGGCNISVGSLNNVPAGNTCFTTVIGNNFTPTQSCQVIIGWAGGGTQASFVQGSTGWTFSSDEKQKTNVVALSEGLELVEKLQPCKYDFVGGCEEGEEGTPSFGLIAQEVAEAIKGTSLEDRGLVVKTDEEHLGLSYSTLTVLLINAVKELSARVKELESK